MKTKSEKESFSRVWEANECNRAKTKNKKHHKTKINVMGTLNEWKTIANHITYYTYDVFCSVGSFFLLVLLVLCIWECSCGR